MKAPYLAIVGEIQRRIEAEELRPGDRVPSARQITQEWHVAIATATKVLATLQQQGLVQAMPGVGTVVSARGGVGAGADTRKRKSTELDLTADRIVAAAVALADGEGIAALSMRRVAADLGVATMSLYRHVRNKEDLVLLMIDAVLGEVAMPADPPAGWRPRLELLSHLQWGLFRKHVWLAGVLSITRPQLAPNGMRHTEFALQSLDGLGLTLEEMMQLYVCLFVYIRGLASGLEPESQAEQDTGVTADEWMELQEGEMLRVTGDGSMPMMRRLSEVQEFELDLDALFRMGLARMLDGFEPYVAARACGGSSATIPAR